MSVRRATSDDLAGLQALYREFFAEWPPADYFGIAVEDELGELDDIVRDEIAVVAEEEAGLLGFALARRRGGTRGELTDVYVRRGARGRGLGRQLVRAATEALRDGGASHVTLTVATDNAAARAVYERWGFRDYARRLVAELGVLERRLGPSPAGPSFGSIHVQTDDVGAVERAVRQFVPRLPVRSAGSVVAPPRNGWTAVYDDACDRDPAMLRRLARELSDRTGAVVVAIGVEDGRVVRYVLWERGRVVDEYLSVPEYHGPLPPGDVVAMGANPTAVARLTGGDPARLRAVARTAPSPDDLPPAPELAASVAAAMGLAGADHGQSAASQIPGAIQITPP